MKWSIRIATVAGTEVRIHMTFFLLLALVAMQGLGAGLGLAGAMQAVLLIAAMFLCVLLHEFGHVFAARGYGIQTPDVTLYPIGGVARLERMPKKPAHELVVALAGPAVNVAIAAVLALVMGVPVVMNPDHVFMMKGGFWSQLMVWNLLMVAFNMVPAFPMDGGRVLRALLAMVMDYGRATRVAASVGQFLAAGVVLLMLFGQWRLNPFLLIIAVFIFVAAGREAAVVGEQEVTDGMRVRDAMQTEFHGLRSDSPLRQAVDYLLAGTQQDFPVVDAAGAMLGLLTRTRLIEALTEHGAGIRVGEVAEGCPAGVGPDEPLARALMALEQSRCPALPVQDLRTGRLIGLLTRENVGETLMVRAALARRRQGVEA
ncbi:MAG: site-2 protease family protein [Verrucomicrobiales bacterium]|nr:site-2 protease family protein [Verrucomicrobiales bacterium]